MNAADRTPGGTEVRETGSKSITPGALPPPSAETVRTKLTEATLGGDRERDAERIVRLLSTPPIVKLNGTQVPPGADRPFEAPAPRGSTAVRLGSSSGHQAVLPAAGPTAFARTPEELILRLDKLWKLSREGKLQEEVRALGVSPEWLTHLHRDPPFIGFTEQQMLLPTLFGNLGKYGGPAALDNSLALLGSLATLLRGYGKGCGPIGMLVSDVHQVTFHGVTNGFFLNLPNYMTANALRAAAENREGVPPTPGPMGKAQLFTKRGRSDFASNDAGGVVYSDLRLETPKLNEVLGWCEKAYVEAQRAHGRFTTQLSKHRDYARTRTDDNQAEQLARTDRQFSEGVRYCGRLIDAVSNLHEDWRLAIAASAGSTTPNGGATQVSYLDFVARFNTLFASRFGPPFEFNTITLPARHEFPSVGVFDWPLLITKLFDTGVALREEPILRYREDRDDGRPSRWRSLWVTDISPGAVTVQDGTSGPSFNVAELAEKSRASLEAGRGPLLIPTSPIIYWIDYALGNSILLDDGIAYQKIERLANAMRSGQLTPHRRELNFYPYTALSGYTPPDPNDPYGALHTQYDVLDYYLYAGCRQ